MNRKSPLIGSICLVSGLALSSFAQGQGNDIQLLKTRVSALESRVAVLENSAASSGATDSNFTNVAYKEPEPVYYTIKEGDRVSDVARKMDIPRTDLMEANNLKEGQQIYIGDRLIIPQAPAKIASTGGAAVKKTVTKPKETKKTAPSTGGSTYTVKYGDTLSKISRQTGVSVAAIKSANNLRSDVIGGGQRLKIPGKGGTTTVSAPVESKKSTSGSKPSNPGMNPGETYGEYTVLKGDNLYALARDFFTTMKELQQINSLGSSTLIYPGDKLIVPTRKYNEYHNKVANR